MPNFSERLRSLRIKNNAMQKDISNALEIAPRTFRGYEGGTREPRISKLIEIADYFNVSTDYLIGRSDDPKRY